MLFTIARSSRFAVVELHEEGVTAVSKQFVLRLNGVVPYKIHTVQRATSGMNQSRQRQSLSERTLGADLLSGIPSCSLADCIIEFECLL